MSALLIYQGFPLPVIACRHDVLFYSHDLHEESITRYVNLFRHIHFPQKVQTDEYHVHEYVMRSRCVFASFQLFKHIHFMKDEHFYFSYVIQKFTDHGTTQQNFQRLNVQLSIISESG